MHTRQSNLRENKSTIHEQISNCKTRISSHLCPGTRAYGTLGVSLEWRPGPLPRAGGEIISCEWWGWTAKPGRGVETAAEKNVLGMGRGEEGTKSLPEHRWLPEPPGQSLQGLHSSLITCIPDAASCTECASTLFGVFPSFLL